MKKIIGRIIIVIPALALQVVWFYLTLGLLNKVTKGHLGEIINGIFTVLAVFFVARLIARRDESSYKLLWVLVIVALPVLGAMLYFTLGNKTTGRALRRSLQKTASELKGLYNGEQLRNTENLDEIAK